LQSLMIRSSIERSLIMKLAAEKELEHIGESCGCEDHDRDLVHELSKRLDALWRYDQYIANADGKPDLQNMWRELKRQDMGNIQQLKDLIGAEIDQNCF
jgi:hypothetical protein